MQVIDLFGWTLFPLAFVLLFLLVMTEFCCESVRKRIIKLIDCLLFYQAPCLPRWVTVFWVRATSAGSFFCTTAAGADVLRVCAQAIMLTSFGFLVAALVQYYDARHRLHDRHNHRDHSCADHKLLFMAERNVWETVFAASLFIAIHRLRHHIKHHLKLQETLDEALDQVEKAGLQSVADFLKDRTGRRSQRCCCCLRRPPRPGDPAELPEADVEAEEYRPLASDGDPAATPQAAAPQAAVLVVLGSLSCVWGYTR